MKKLIISIFILNTILIQASDGKNDPNKVVLKISYYEFNKEKSVVQKIPAFFNPIQDVRTIIFDDYADKTERIRNLCIQKPNNTAIDIEDFKSDSRKILDKLDFIFFPDRYYHPSCIILINKKYKINCENHDLSLFKNRLLSENNKENTGENMNFIDWDEGGIL